MIDEMSRRSNVMLDRITRKPLQAYLKVNDCIYKVAKMMDERSRPITLVKGKECTYVDFPCLDP